MHESAVARPTGAHPVWNKVRVVVLVTGFALAAGCRGDHPPATRVEETVRALNASPKIGDFVLAATNSIRLQTGGAVIAGGDVGARGSGSGPFLSGGVAIDLSTGAACPTNRNVIADSVRLGTGVTVGDIQTNRLVDGTGTHHGSVSSLVQLPAAPTAATANPGTTNLTVATGGTLTASAGRYANVSVGTGGKLKLGVGVYELAALTMSTGARLEVLGPVVLHIQGRLNASTGVYIGAAAGVTATARDVRIEVSGINGSTGALGATPPAATVGAGAVITALVLVPNGSFVAGTGINATGALMARDLDIGGAGAHITFQDGFDCVGAANGTLCDDRDRCTQTDTCASGVCVGSNPVVCVVSDQCHAGACDSATGECTTHPLADGAACNDGNLCTQTDTCHAGVCVGTTPVVCVASDQCHLAGDCSPATGLCSNPPKGDGTACDDGNACTQADFCESGVCVGQSAVVCTASDQCHDVGTCDPANGRCSGLPKADGAACDDGSLCTRTDVCQAGSCIGTNPVACVALDQCHAVGTCDPQSGSCSNPPAADGTTCNDSNACTSGDACATGACSGVPVACAPPDQCHEAGICDPANGSCAYAQKADGTSCDDGNPCTQGDACQAGVCAGAPVQCLALDQCHVAGACDPSTGICSNPTKADGTTCNDGNACTQTDTCQSGACAGSNAKTCTALDQCHVPGVCEPATGACSNPNKADGVGCDDNNACTRGDTCQAGLCTSGPPVACTASDQCHTAGTCDPATGQCSQPVAPGDTPCDDGDPSTSNDTCVDGTCVGGSTACALMGTLEAGGNSTCATWNDGSLFCWGDNGYGQLGDGTTSQRLAPVTIAGTSWSAVSVGGVHTCAVTAEGGLWCWGQNTSGQLGDNSTTQRLAPVPVDGSGWASVSVPPASGSHTCGLKRDGSLYCWGANSAGQLGDGTMVGKRTPNPVPGTGWASVSTGASHTCAIRTDGKLYCWGSNSYGQLGIGSTNPWYRSAPTEVGGDGWAGVAAAYQHTCATKTDGTLYCWGGNSYGQLGIGNKVQQYTPQPVGGSNWSTVAMGLYHSCATKSDGSIWCWGVNYDGQLGIGASDPKTTPVQLSGTDWKSLSVGAYHACGIRQDDSAWCWGSGYAGQLGNGGTSSADTPIKIGATGCKGACGDGRRDWNEQCDDGNHAAGDGCGAACRREICGNGTLDPGEECDDGNVLSGDGCSSTCRREPCGNGTLDQGEECDDGNRVSGDGCSAMCLREICGNGRVDAGEECDDGNQVDNDACSNTCRTNRCYGVDCSWSGQPCRPAICNPSNGYCELTVGPDGSPCDDNNACTQTDVCHSGQCVGSDPPDCTARNQCQIDGTCDPAKGCVIPFKADGTACDDQTACTVSDACEAGQCLGVVTSTCFESQVAAVSPAVPTTVAAGSAFLYTGADAVQTGISPATVDPVRAAVVRGHVRGRDGSPIAGAKISIAGHSEFGQTRTREDGWFDMVVNGGGRLHLLYEKRGYLRADRNVEAAWQDSNVAPEVVMVALDPAVTTVDLPSGALQVARGSLVTDEDGTRQAAVFFPPNVTATMTTWQNNIPLNRLSVRATEYTVGPDGPAAMPAVLPSNSGYTYAVELSVDEAIAADALSVVFSAPVYLYVNNFINLPVGASAPLGTYDRMTNSQSLLSAWTPAPSGRVVKVLQILGGRAVLAVDGTGLPASTAALAALGVTDEERAAIAASYGEGQTLWRVPILHFSPQDVNLPYGYPHGIEDAHGSPEQEACKPCSEEAEGSIIECENQVLGQRIPVAGTPFTMEYRSRHADGDKRQKSLSLAAAPLSPTAQALLKEVVVKTRVAGQEIEQRYDKTSYPAANPRFDFSWNGQDAYGRNVQGAQKAQVTLGYVYPILYRSQADLDIIFGEWATPPASIVSRSAATITLLADVSNTAGARGAPQITLGSLRAPVGELGGWSINVHHLYDPQERVLYLGDGGVQTADDVKQVVDVAAGNGESVVSGQYVSGPATRVPVEFWWDRTPAVVVAPTGDLIFADSNELGKVDRAGNLTRFGYISSVGFYVSYLSVGYDGAIYLTANNGAWKEYVIRVMPPYDAHAFAMANSYRVAQGERVWAIAPSPDGSFYVAPGEYMQPSRILKLTPDGQVRQVAGKSTAGYSPDGTAAANASLTVYDIAAGPDGSLYVSEGARIRRIGPDGILTTVAGTGVQGYSGDGGPALAAKIWAATLRVSSDGTVYLADNTTIRHIGADGIITTLVGNGQSGTIVDGGSARAPLSVSTFTVAPDGSLFFVEKPNLSTKHIWRVSQPLPGYEAMQSVLASKNGSELYVFDADGRHLRTDDALMGIAKYRFDYTPDGLLSLVTDRDGLATSIERTQAGQPTAIVAPNGQRTVLGLDPNAYLASITDPGGNTYAFTYKPDGLMETLRDPGHNLHTFEFDEMGRLKKDSDPAGGFTTLARDGYSKDYTVTKTTAESRATAYHVEALADGSSRTTITSPAGLTDAQATDPSGNTTWSTPDGMNGTVTIGPDPLRGMQVPLAKSTVTRTPSGNQITVNMSRVVTQDAGNNLVSQVDTRTINSKAAFTRTYNAAAKTVTSVSPMGRQTVATLDEKGRVVQVQAGNLALTTYSYDTRGRLAAITVGTGQSARATTFGYDVRDRLTSVTDPVTRVQQYIYDDANRVVGQIFPDTKQVGFTYDANGNVTSVTPPERPAHAFAFTPVDLMSSYTPPPVAGTGATTYEYNLDKQPTVIHRPDGSQIVFTYDSAGRLSATTYPAGPAPADGNITVLRSYDPVTGTLQSLTTSDGQTLTYGFDGSLLLSAAWIGTVAGTTGRTYGHDFSIASETVFAPGGLTVAFGYDNDAHVTTIGGMNLVRNTTNGLITDTSLGDMSDHRAYNGIGDLTSYEAKCGAGILHRADYAGDAIGRIEQKTETIQGTTTVWSYSYDPAGRLWQVVRDGVLTATYLYDANGNRQRKATPSTSEAATYDDQDRLLTYGKWAYTYTAVGDRRTKTDTATGEVTTYSYDGAGNLRKVQLPNGTMIEYMIDGWNRRVAKKANGTIVRSWLYRNQLSILAEFDGNGVLVAQLVGDILYMNGAAYRVIKDHLGSPRLIVDPTTCAVVARIDYDEWGRVIATAGTSLDAFGFLGGLFDKDTGLVRLGSRDYDPENGRWTSVDPILFSGRSANLYSYADNDPVNGRDPNGKFSLDNDFRNRYRRSAACIDSIIGRMTQNKYDAYETFTRSDKEKVDNALKPGKGPKCKSKKLPDDCGAFNPSSKEISIDDSVLNNLENSKVTCEQLTATLEHELAHYLYDSAFGPEPKSKEIGRNFEDYVYGKPVPCTPGGAGPR